MSKTHSYLENEFWVRHKMSNVKNVGPRQSLMRHPLLREPEVSPQGSRSVVIAIIANDNSVMMMMTKK